MKTKIRAIPFFSTVGVEFTYLPGGKEKPSDESCDEYVRRIEKDFRKARVKPWGVYNDENAIEICSPVCRSIEELRAFYLVMERIVRKHRLVTHRKDVYSGGGHIHVGVPRRWKRNPTLLATRMVAVFRWLARMPCLNWVFNEWCNQTSARPFSVESLPYDFGGLVVHQAPLIPVGAGIADVLDVVSIGKPFMALYASETNTIEFRFFDAKRNWEEVLLHVNFLNASLHFLEMVPLGRYFNGRVPTLDDDYRESALLQFRHWLQNIGLKESDYERFIAMNYRVREKQGLLK